MAGAGRGAGARPRDRPQVGAGQRRRRPQAALLSVLLRALQLPHVRCMGSLSRSTQSVVMT